MKDPSPNDAISFPWQTKTDEFGLWNKSTKRSTSDRFFCPSQGSSDDSKESFLTCPPASCSDPQLKMLLDSKPLVKGIAGGKKALELSLNIRLSSPWAILQLCLKSVQASRIICPGSSTIWIKRRIFLPMMVLPMMVLPLLGSALWNIMHPLW